MFHEFSSCHSTPFHTYLQTCIPRTYTHFAKGLEASKRLFRQTAVVEKANIRHKALLDYTAHLFILEKLHVKCMSHCQWIPQAPSQGRCKLSPRVVSFPQDRPSRPHSLYTLIHEGYNLSHKFRFSDQCTIKTLSVIIKLPKDGQNPEGEDYINKPGKKKQNPTGRCRFACSCQQGARDDIIVIWSQCHLSVSIKGVLYFLNVVANIGEIFFVITRQQFTETRGMLLTLS